MITGNDLAKILEEMFLKPAHSNISTLNISKYEGLVTVEINGWVSLDELAQKLNSIADQPITFGR